MAVPGRPRAPVVHQSAPDLRRKPRPHADLHRATWPSAKGCRSRALLTPKGWRLRGLRHAARIRPCGRSCRDAACRPDGTASISILLPRPRPRLRTVATTLSISRQISLSASSSGSLRARGPDRGPGGRNSRSLFKNSLRKEEADAPSAAISAFHVALAASVLTLVFAAGAMGAPRSFFGIVPQKASRTPTSTGWVRDGSARCGSPSTGSLSTPGRPPMTTTGRPSTRSWPARPVTGSTCFVPLRHAGLGGPGPRRAGLLGLRDICSHVRRRACRVAHVRHRCRRPLRDGRSVLGREPGVTQNPIEVWQIWNEQNSATFYEPKPSLKAYASSST